MRGRARLQQPTLPLCGSMWEEGLERGLCRCLASRDEPGTCPVSSHFIHTLYSTGTFPAFALVLNPRVGGFANVLRQCRPFMWSFLKIQQFLPAPKPQWFLQPEVVEIYLLGTGTLGCTVWPGAGITHSQGIPPDFYSLYVNAGLPVPIPLPLPPLHTTLYLLTSLPSLWVSAPPTHLDECGFFKSLVVDFHTVQSADSSGCYLFWDLVVILFVVAQEGKAYLPMPPSWLEVVY